MEYAIFPMKTISISQRYTDSHKAWDLNGDSPKFGEKSKWYAPCTIKVKKIYPYTGTSNSYRNTVVFVSCDLDGNPTAVMCNDKKPRILTFACTHMDQEDFDDMFTYGKNIGKYKVGDVIPNGEYCYSEGFTGLDPNNPDHGYHVHMEVGNGNIDKSGAYLSNTTDEEGNPLIPNIFFSLSGFNKVGNSGAKNYTFETVSSRVCDNSITPIVPTNTTGIYLYGVKSGFYVRNKPNDRSSYKEFVERYQQAEIISFLPSFYYDSNDNKNYQWAQVKTNKGNFGYVQLDLNFDYKIVCDSTHDRLYIRAKNMGLNIRASVPNGTILKTLSKGERIEIKSVQSTHNSSNGFQYGIVTYNNKTAYVQMDTVGNYLLEF